MGTISRDEGGMNSEDPNEAYEVVPIEPAQGAQRQRNEVELHL